MSIERQSERLFFADRMKVKFHTRKFKNMNSNNSELLIEYEKLKFENKGLANQEQHLLQELRNNKEGPVQNDTDRRKVIAHLSHGKSLSMGKS
jgi:hypothetical protein